MRGRCSLERKLCFGKATNYDDRVQDHKDDAKGCFEGLVKRGADLVAQLLLVTHVTGTSRPVSLRTDLFLYTEEGGWTTLLAKNEEAVEIETVDDAWDACRKLQHRKAEVCSLPELYQQLDLDTNHCGRDVSKWTGKGAGLGLVKDRDFPQKVVRRGSGNKKRFVVTKAVVKKVWPRLTRRAVRQRVRQKF